MKSIFKDKALVFQSGGYREMRAEIRAGEEALKRAAVRRAKEERKERFLIVIWNCLCYTVDTDRRGSVFHAGRQGLPPICIKVDG